MCVCALDIDVLLSPQAPTSLSRLMSWQEAYLYVSRSVKEVSAAAEIARIINYLASEVRSYAAALKDLNKAESHSVLDNGDGVMLDNGNGTTPLVEPTLRADATTES